MQLRNSRYMQRGATKSLHQLGDSKGSLLMLLVAFLWSLTSTFDKMGMAASPTLAVYLGVQRAMVAVPCVLYLLVKDLASFRCVRCLLSNVAHLHNTALLRSVAAPPVKFQRTLHITTYQIQSVLICI